jgi:hypothetical protein
MLDSRHSVSRRKGCCRKHEAEKLPGIVSWGLPYFKHRFLSGLDTEEEEKVEEIKQTRLIMRRRGRW